MPLPLSTTRATTSSDMAVINAGPETRQAAMMRSRNAHSGTRFFSPPPSGYYRPVLWDEHGRKVYDESIHMYLLRLLTCLPQHVDVGRHSAADKLHVLLAPGGGFMFASGVYILQDPK